MNPRARQTAVELRALDAALGDWAAQCDGKGLGGIVGEAAREAGMAANAVADAVHAGWRADDAIARFGAAWGRLLREIARSLAATTRRPISARQLDAVREHQR